MADSPAIPGSIVPPDEGAIWERLTKLDKRLDEVFALAGGAQAVAVAAQGAASAASAASAQALSASAAASTASTQALAASSDASAASSAALAAASTANAAIAGLVSAQVNSASGSFTWGTGYATAASFNLTIPTGYTQAVIIASGGIAGFSSASGDIFYAQTVINGSTGAESRAAFTGGSDVPYLSAFHALTITGLTGGATIPVLFRARLTSGGGNSSTANLIAMAIYLK